MKVIKGLNRVQRFTEGSVVTIGVFDGMHIGHQLIIGKVASRAKELNLKSVVITFDPHPLKVLHPKSGVPSLISLDHRIRLIGELGVDILVILKFTKSIANLAPEQFVKNIMIDKIGIKEIYVGDNFYFGKGATAGIEVMRNLAGDFNFKINIIKPIKIDGDIVSSSLIRKLIIKGDIVRALKFLARPVSILGTVVSGSRLARRLGYPTANINPHHEVIPPSGVYAVLVSFKNKLLKGVLNIGTRPTFYGPRDREPAIEVHIFNFDKRIYGKDLEILFIKKLRDEKRFKNIDDLVSRIRLDEKRARSILKWPRQFS